MMNPLRSDADVRKLVTSSLDGDNNELRKAVNRIAREAPDQDMKDIAAVGLTALDGVQGADQVADMARRRAGKATLEVVREKDRGEFDVRGRVGEELTEPSKAYAPLVNASEAVMRAMMSASVPGPVGAALALALDIGAEVRKPGHTTTEHSAFNVDALHHSMGPGEQFDFVGLNGVYHAAFSSVALRKDVTGSEELASLGSSMLLYVEEGNRRYSEEMTGYSRPPDTAQVVAREVFQRIADEQPVWSQLGMKLADGGPAAEGSRSLLDFVADGKEPSALNLLAIGRQIMPQLPEGRRDAVATTVLELVGQAPDHEVAADLMGRVREGSWTPSQAVTEGLEEISRKGGDDWVLHGKTNAPSTGVGAADGYVNVNGVSVKMRKGAAPREETGAADAPAAPPPDQDRVRSAVEQMLDAQRAEEDDDYNHPDLVAQREHAARQAPQAGAPPTPEPQVHPQAPPSPQAAPEPQFQSQAPPEPQFQSQAAPRPQPQAQQATVSQPGYDPSKFGANTNAAYNPSLFGSGNSVRFDPSLFGARMPIPTDLSMGAVDPRYATMDPRMAMDPRFGGAPGFDPRMGGDPRFGGGAPGFDPRMGDPRFGGGAPGFDPRMGGDPRFGGGAPGFDPRMGDPRFGGPQWNQQPPWGQGPYERQGGMSGWKIAALCAGAAIGLPLLLGAIF